MHPLAARFHDEIVLLNPHQKTLIEAQLSQVAKGYGDKSFEQVSAECASNDNFWGEPGSFIAYVRPYVVVDGVLQIPVKGVLLHDFPYALGTYATGYAYIWKAFERGMNDGAVKGIAFMIDSPGGMVAGCFDLVDKVYSFRGNKPIRAFAHESAYSAAYAIASVADKIVVSRTGGVGSVGVLTTHVSFEEAYKKMGIEITYIYAGDHKVDGNSTEKLKPEVKARIQTKIDVLYDLFVETVARNRNMDEKAIRNTKASTFMASEAVANGMADSIGTLDDATAEFATEVNADETGDETMSTRNADQQKHYDEGMTAGRTAASTEHTAALATATSTATTAGATAERERIAGILSCANAKDRPIAALATATDTPMSVEAANTYLGKLPKESPAPAANGKPGAKGGAPLSDFAKAMETADHPDAGSAHEQQGNGGEQGNGDGLTRAQRAMQNAGYPKAKSA